MFKVGAIYFNTVDDEFYIVREMKFLEDRKVMINYETPNPKISQVNFIFDIDSFTKEFGKELDNSVLYVGEL